MIAIIASLIVVTVSLAVVRWIASVPLLNTLSASIDLWADGVQGEGPEQPA